MPAGRMPAACGMWRFLSWRDSAPPAPRAIAATFYYAAYQRAARHDLQRWLALADRVQSSPAGAHAAFEALDCSSSEEERDMDEGLKELPAVVVYGPGRSRHAFEGHIDFEALEEYMVHSLEGGRSSKFYEP